MVRIFFFPRTHKKTIFLEKLMQWQRKGINTLVTPAINVSIVGKGLGHSMKTAFGLSF
jgi:hypothetical protein